jgi:hypothetical protein
MRELLTGVGVVVAVMVASWGIMIVLARHLPRVRRKSWRRSCRTA